MVSSSRQLRAKLVSGISATTCRSLKTFHFALELPKTSHYVEAFCGRQALLLTYGSFSEMFKNCLNFLNFHNIYFQFAFLFLIYVFCFLHFDHDAAMHRFLHVGLLDARGSTG